MPFWNTDIGEICRQLTEYVTLNDDGSFSTPDFSFLGSYEFILSNSCQLDPDLGQEIKADLIRDAIPHARRRGEITPRSLESSIRQQERRYLERPIQQYYLLTNLSITRSTSSLLKRIQINRSTISFPKQIAKENQSWMEHCFRASAFQGQHFPHSYQLVRISTQGRSPWEAGEQALRNLDLLRATWNLALNQRWRETFSGGQKPVNEILLGPIQALYQLSDGEPASQQWWYTPEFNSWSPSTRFEQQYERIRDYQKRLMRGAKRYQNQILNDMLSRYVRALDLPDWELSVLRLWSVLETGTIGQQMGDGRRTITRAASLFADKTYMQPLLEGLRRTRNQHVHSGTEIGRAEVAMYELKSVVEALIHFHLLSSFRFRNFEEACGFLDLPGTNVLDRRLELYEYAKRFRGE